MEINILVFLVPIFLGFIFFEWYKSYKGNHNNYKIENTINNIGLGIIDQLGAIFYLAIMYLIFNWIYDNFSIFYIGTTWYGCILTLIATDFTFYVYHRASHEINIFWAAHNVHHSSDKFNFTVAFRLSIFQAINRIIFWAFLPFIGFDPLVTIICFKLLGIYAFFLHTTYIPKLGFLENVLYTPSMHRVHHSKQEEYIDKNYGAILVVWDKIFGTYKEETEEVLYGLSGNYEDKNPFHAIVHHYVHIARTWKKLDSVGDRLKLLFYKPSWHYKVDELMVEKKQKKSINKSWQRYGYYQIIISLFMFMGVLAYSKNLGSILFFIYSMYIITNVIVVGSIFNSSMNRFLLNLEKCRNGFFLIVFLLLIFIFQLPHLYILLLLSLVGLGMSYSYD